MPKPNSRHLIYILFILFLLNACIATTRGVASSEALILASGVEIPCEILEVDDDYVYFEAAIAQDRYKYGESMPIGEVKFIKLFRQDDVIYLALEDYLKQNTELFAEVEAYNEDEGEAEISDTEKSQNKQIQSGLLEREFSRFSEPEKEQRVDKPTFGSVGAEGPGLRLQKIAQDSLLKKNKKSGIGLRIPGDLQKFTKPELSDSDYSDMADLIVASGAAGLILFRAEKFDQAGVALSGARQKLVDKIRSSQQWQKRREGLLAAHRVVAEDFAASYKDVKESVTEKFGFSARDDQDEFIAFMLFLHTHGGIQSPRKRRQLDEWFGEIATRAMADILANFDDWYYIAVIRAR